jgi:L-lactate dehydrogenase complex protein LldG
VVGEKSDHRHREELVSTLPDSAEARAEILRRIRAAHPERMPAVAIARDYELSLAPSFDRVELFAERVADYRAVVKRVDRAGLAARVASSLAGRGASRIVVPAGLDPEWFAEAAEAGVEAVLDDSQLSHQELDALDGVITACAAAIAETGTIILDGDAGQGRRALSLLPDYHLCVVRVEQIAGTVPEAMERLDPRRPQTWISGPSATSDIELERVEGVHGPRNLEVLIVE